MKYKLISGTDLQSYIISLGSVAIGCTLNEEDSFRLMDMYIDRGGNMIDTAASYSDWLSVKEKSASEKMIGKWMKARNNRDRLIVATKGGYPNLETYHIPRLSKTEILHDLEGSLQRLQVYPIESGAIGFFGKRIKTLIF